MPAAGGGGGGGPPGLTIPGSKRVVAAAIGSAPMRCPQCGQNSAWTGSSAPHDGHCRTASSSRTVAPTSAITGTGATMRTTMSVSPMVMRSPSETGRSPISRSPLR